MDPAQIERVARAICATDCPRSGDGCNQTAAGCREWQGWTREAAAAIGAMTPPPEAQTPSSGQKTGPSDDPMRMPDLW